MDVYRLEKKRLNSFLVSLMADMEVIAPVKTDVVRFQAIKDPKDINLAEQPYTPAKEFFFKQHEVIFQFNGTKIEVPIQKEPIRAFFGMRRCDLNAVRHQDIVFIQDAQDPYYIAQRKNSYLIGYHCPAAPSEYCFCGSLDLADFFDLMFYDRGELFLVEVGSDKGRELIQKYGKLFERHNRLIIQDEKKIPGTDRLKNADISGFYNHPDWQKGASQCLSCGACTTLCPTCYCFEMHDDMKTSNPNEGERKRGWSSCQIQEFTRVAGDHVFRQKREERFKHRIYHQLEYFKERYGVQMCVGCGRCISGCPTRIDFVQIINGMS